MERKIIHLVICLLLMLVLVSSIGCAPVTSPEESAKEDTAQKSEKDSTVKYDLKLAHFFPAAHILETDYFPRWANEIKEATDGQVIITSYPGETLLKASEMYDGVVNGIAEIGFSCFSYTRGRFPLLEVFELPGLLYENSKVAGKVAWEGVKELNPEEVQDTKLMMVFATGPGNLFTKKPVRSLDDLKGMEIRATGLSAKTLEALGAVPVAMPQSDTYEALSKGVIQGNLAPNEVLDGWGHAEVTEYVTLTPFLYNTLFFLTMNLDTWNSLPPDLQSTIEQINEKYHEEVFIGAWDFICDRGLKYAIEETGHEIINLSEDETARWIELLKMIQDNFVTDQEAKGLPGREALDLTKKLADKYNEIFK